MEEAKVGDIASVSIEGTKHILPTVAQGTITSVVTVTPKMTEGGAISDPYQRVIIQVPNTGNGIPGTIDAPVSQVTLLKQGQ